MNCIRCLQLRWGKSHIPAKKRNNWPRRRLDSSPKVAQLEKRDHESPLLLRPPHPSGCRHADHRTRSRLSELSANPKRGCKASTDKGDRYVVLSHCKQPGMEQGQEISFSLPSEMGCLDALAKLRSRVCSAASFLYTAWKIQQIPVPRPVSVGSFSNFLMSVISRNVNYF